MITKTITAGFELPRNYWPRCLGEEKMISERQRNTLTEIICANFQDEERELRLSQLENMTAVEATDAIYDYSVGSWR